MRSPEARALAGKDAREQWTALSTWLLLALAGVLVGHSFMIATEWYAEMSGSAGGPAALTQGLSPLDGIVVPIWGAYYIVAILLLPFVVIRLIAQEKQTGAWKLMQQSPASIATMLSSKAIVLLLGWLIAWIPGVLALVFWKAHGGHLQLAETMTVLLGHLLLGWLTIGVAAAAAGFANSSASAAIGALAFTVGTWAIDLGAAARGGLLAKLARYTPYAALKSFEHGLIQLDTVIVLIAAGIAGVTLAGIWLDSGKPIKRRALLGSALLMVFALIALASTRINRSWDVSEDRRNSFAREDEAALRTIREPLSIEINLAAEDPRLTDLQRGVIDKLQRVLPSVDVTYTAKTRTGLFEGRNSNYGEVWYELGGRREMTRSTTPPIVLEVLYHLAGMAPPSHAEESYPGYPMPTPPRHILWVFFVAWPLLCVLGAYLMRRSPAPLARPRKQRTPLEV